MKELKRLLAICLLMASMSGVVLAEGGDTQGPPSPPPPSGLRIADTTEVEASTQPAKDSSVDIATSVDLLANWLALAIL